MSRVLTAFLPFALGYFLSFLFRTLNAVVAPVIDRELALGEATIGLVTSLYLAGFTAAQLPAGLALDRFGPHRVAPCFLAIGALGAVVFGLGQDALTLGLGRVLIGVGVSVALMAGFKANVLYWPLGRLPLVNAVMMTFGGLGAAMATRPVQWLLVDHDWRHLFYLLAAITLAVALYQIAVAPRAARAAGGGLGPALGGLWSVARTPLLWRAGLAPTLSFGVWVAYTSFWIAGWLRDAARLDEAATGTALLLLSLAIIPGYFFSGLIVDRLARRGVRGGAVLLAYGMLFVAMHAGIALFGTAAPVLSWVVYVMLGGCMAVSFALITRAFAPELAGRVNTTLNLVCMLLAFVVQAAIGPALGALESAHGLGRGAAHQVVLLVLGALQAAAWAWFATGRGARGLR